MIEPFDHGLLDVGDAHELYWEQCGNPSGKAAIVLHGGPGSGCTPHHRLLFDADRYRAVLFDQRNCGRSRPHASDWTVDLGTNTTPHLIDDIERLRDHLGIDQWLVFGNSWGSTLALAYAERHPERVSEIVLMAVTMTRPADIDWLYHGAGRFHPAAWERFHDGVPTDARDGDLVAAYYERLHDPDVTVRERAAIEWCAWEDSVIAVHPDTPPDPRYDDPRFRIAFARIVTHYFHHHAWLPDGDLLHHADRLAGIPGALVHGFLDIGGPVHSAWELARAWPDATLTVVDSGHGGVDLVAATIAAINAFAGS